MSLRLITFLLSILLIASACSRSKGIKVTSGLKSTDQAPSDLSTAPSGSSQGAFMSSPLPQAPMPESQPLLQPPVFQPPPPLYPVGSPPPLPLPAPIVRTGICGGARVEGKDVVVPNNGCIPDYTDVPFAGDMSCDRRGCATFDPITGTSGCPTFAKQVFTSENPDYFICITSRANRPDSPSPFSLANMQVCGGTRRMGPYILPQDCTTPGPGCNTWGRVVIENSAGDARCGPGTLPVRLSDNLTYEICLCETVHPPPPSLVHVGFNVGEICGGSGGELGLPFGCATQEGCRPWTREIRTSDRGDFLCQATR